MAGKRLTKEQARRVLSALALQFTTAELEAQCAAMGVSYDTLSRRMQEWGWVRCDGVLHEGASHRPRRVYTRLGMLV